MFHRWKVLCSKVQFLNDKKVSNGVSDFYHPRLFEVMENPILEFRLRSSKDWKAMQELGHQTVWGRVIPSSKPLAAVVFCCLKKNVLLFLVECGYEFVFWFVSSNRGRKGIQQWSLYVNKGQKGAHPFDPKLTNHHSFLIAVQTCCRGHSAHLTTQLHTKLDPKKDDGNFWRELRLTTFLNVSITV